MRLLYSCLLYLITPLVLLRLWWKGFELPDYRRRWGERFGFVPAPEQPVEVWVHAVSVGESLAALPLIRALVARHGEGRVLVTTMTPTGSQRVREALGPQVLHTYLPYDLPDVVGRYVARMRPHRVVVMETELWPNLFRALARRGVPLLVANARLSPRSFKGYGRVRGFASSVLSDCTEVAAQSDADAERFRALGAPRVSTMGNIKFDLALPEALLDLGRRLRAALGARPVWIAASTHEGEEEAALAVHRELRKALPDAALILVPRHPQRFDGVTKLASRDFACVRRSAWTGEGLVADVLLGDSMGEMFAYFAASDVAFVGGSLVPVGGHNVLEPAALGLPVLFGPQMHNFIAARDLLLGEQAAEQVADATQLAAALTRLLRDPAQRSAMGEAGRRAVAANRGALQKLLELLDRA
ncbi:lipid IV(A) 3-deoxy-D-manno-octulosonic acid transferase [Solimonas sp. SE-A11]|uniref:lipid IV(A) 3-deoxy-D-manno-octulosonic acid transferase n=1 Tax=Solimonas sp. SE-A11 TaxID=3054954 RepID=UPI00259CCBCB|nr:lipid IV(A) 3-deoxy-D-manno-octulosonic acid transferase [Solimonas sp. SE-A11]MDM4771633.1 lipid IV(A) 3-deoxy-D-manno-octulosonic acid transferase [Solimonas sp. SE-A11]